MKQFFKFMFASMLGTFLTLVVIFLIFFVFLISLILAIIALISVFIFIPVVSLNAFWVAIVAYILLAAGCVLKGFEQGLVDFYGMYEGRVVCLCWLQGEGSVTHWHELDAGFSGRRPIDDGHAFERSFLS